MLSFKANTSLPASGGHGSVGGHVLTGRSRCPVLGEASLRLSVDTLLWDVRTGPAWPAGCRPLSVHCSRIPSVRDV